MSDVLASRSVLRPLRAVVSLALVGALLALAPFAVALEVHHELAAADQDGHQHSDTDLCQWVQHHTSSSLQTVVPAVGSLFAISFFHIHVPSTLLSFQLSAAGSPRAPPQS